MLRGIFKNTTFAVVAAVAGVGTAQAGGLERGGYNIDLLFDPSPFNFESSFTYVMPDRTLKNTVDTDPSNGLGANGIGGGDTSVRESVDYAIPRFGIKVNVVDPIDCLFDYSEPWGAHTHPGANWVGANSNIETEVKSNNFAATCSYKFAAGPGQFRMIGGAFWQEVHGFKDRLVAGGLPSFLGTGVGHLELAGEGHGWRAGIAYEIPDIAFRASLVYNSEVELNNITGMLDLTQVPAVILPAGDPRRPFFGVSTPVFGSASMPDSVELKLQSGVAPGWLAFGSVKWVDWSELQNVIFCPEITRGIASCVSGSPTKITSLDLIYRDGWTITGGVGHKFNDQLSGAVALNWDRGTSQGFGSRTDTWSVSAGTSFTPNDRIEFRLGALAGILTSGHSGAITRGGVTYGDDVSYDFGNDFVGALSLAARVKF